MRLSLSSEQRLYQNIIKKSIARYKIKHKDCVGGMYENEYQSSCKKWKKKLQLKKHSIKCFMKLNAEDWVANNFVIYIGFNDWFIAYESKVSQYIFKILIFCKTEIKHWCIETIFNNSNQKNVWKNGWKSTNKNSLCLIRTTSSLFCTV